MAKKVIPDDSPKKVRWGKKTFTLTNGDYFVLPRTKHVLSIHQIINGRPRGHWDAYIVIDNSAARLGTVVCSALGPTAQKATSKLYKALRSTEKSLRTILK